MPDSPTKETLLLETYKLLRSEIDHLCKNFDTYAIAGVVGTATAWAWLLTYKEHVANHQVFYLAPGACALFFGIRVYAIMRAVTEIGTHLSKIEKHFGLTKENGWELYCKAEREACEETNRVRTSSLLGVWQWGFWPALILVNFLAAVKVMGGFC
ncbi:MAG: hypothetical protein HS117_10405 [Verrucomicrobiaceae bacterium]|nr:hypothetical protein [Verrucomicrobiaceae bacterium]